jgi:hypothetical protein
MPKACEAALHEMQSISCQRHSFNDLDLKFKLGYFNLKKIYYI